MQKQNIILAVKGPEVPEQLMNDLISLVQAKGYEIEFAGVHREHGKMDCAIGTVEQLDGVPVPAIFPSGEAKLPKVIELLTLQNHLLTSLTKGETLTHGKLDEVLHLMKADKQPAEAPKTRRKSAAEKKEGGAGETGSQESAPDEKQAEESAGDDGQESETGDPQQQKEESAA